MAATLAALYEDVSRYPEPHAQNLRWLLRDYTRYVIKYAWPLQQRGIVPEEGTIRADFVTFVIDAVTSGACLHKNFVSAL